MGKRGNIAVFLVVLFIAAIGLLVIFSGPSTTGMAVFWGPTLKNLPGTCGSPCLKDRDCSGECNKCSPSLGRCIGLPKGKETGTLLSQRYSWRANQRCYNSCAEIKKWCVVNARNDAMLKKCDVNYPKCISGCDSFHAPVGKEATKV
ncbi:MAG: hypothetical protein QXR48_02435 [Candidatus Woesearchaeota archaeon]